MRTYVEGESIQIDTAADEGTEKTTMHRTIVLPMQLKIAQITSSTAETDNFPAAHTDNIFDVPNLNANDNSVNTDQFEYYNIDSECSPLLTSRPKRAAQTTCRSNTN